VHLCLLRDYGGAASAPTLVEALGDSGVQLRGIAGSGLRRLGADAMPALLGGLRHADETVRKGVSDFLSQRSMPADCVPLFRDHLRTNPGASERRTVIVALGLIGQHAAAAVPDLRAALDDADAAVREAAAVALGGIGPPARDAIPTLLRELERTKSL